MICVYCGRETKGTREHIISSGVLDLFPECFMTFDGEREKLYPSDPVVKDVCAVCNNKRISYIDTYANNIIQKQFVKMYEKDDELIFEYDLTLVQKMCLKYAFNDLRSRKKDTVFFDNEIKDFIANDSLSTPLRNITIMAGLAINTSPMPNFAFGNNKIRWGDNPFLLSNSIVLHVDYDTGFIQIRDALERQELPKLAISYIFRFNSLQLLMLCWDKSIDDKMLYQNEVLLAYQYPYQLLKTSGITTLSRCTSEVTFHIEKLIDVTWGQALMDDISEMRGTFTEDYQRYLQLIGTEWESTEITLANEHPR